MKRTKGKNVKIPNQTLFEVDIICGLEVLLIKSYVNYINKELFL